MNSTPKKSRERIEINTPVRIEQRNKITKFLQEKSPETLKLFSDLDNAMEESKKETKKEHAFYKTKLMRKVKGATEFLSEMFDGNIDCTNDLVSRIIFNVLFLPHDFSVTHESIEKLIAAFFKQKNDKNKTKKIKIKTARGPNDSLVEKIAEILTLDCFEELRKYFGEATLEDFIAFCENRPRSLKNEIDERADVYGIMYFMDEGEHIDELKEDYRYKKLVEGEFQPDVYNLFRKHSDFAGWEHLYKFLNRMSVEEFKLCFTSLSKIFFLPRSPFVELLLGIGKLNK